MHLTIIGAGRVGDGLARRAAAMGRAHTLLDRAGAPAGLSAAAPGPLLVATRNDDLDAVVDATPAARRPDLVFVQNGMLRPWLERRGLGASTRGLLFFAVARRGDPISPGGVSPFCGPHAEAMVRCFEALGLPARVVAPPDFAAEELEKLLWNCVFGLLCERHQCSVGQLVEAHRGEVDALARELASLGAKALGIAPALDPLVERLCAYSTSIPDYVGAVKEYAWRNGWFVDLSSNPEDMHARLLRQVGKLG